MPWLYPSRTAQNIPHDMIRGQIIISNLTFVEPTLYRRTSGVHSAFSKSKKKTTFLYPLYPVRFNTFLLFLTKTHLCGKLFAVTSLYITFHGSHDLPICEKYIITAMYDSVNCHCCVVTSTTCICLLILHIFGHFTWLEEAAAWRCPVCRAGNFIQEGPLTFLTHFCHFLYLVCSTHFCYP